MAFEGVAGIRQAINYLQSIRGTLAGHTPKGINITTKWDGAPAIIAGINPENGRFFVATKSAFNKTPKLNYTGEDIDKNHSGEGLNEKLKYALRYLPELGLKGIYQGDMLYTHKDLSTENIDGEDCIIFQPNTIVYAVPSYSPLAKTIQNSKMGIVWHTQYTGENIASLKASFGVNAANFTPSKNVWSRDASFVDLSGTATFDIKETKQITELLSYAGTIFTRMSPGFLNRVASIELIKIQIKTYNNTMVRQGKRIQNVDAHIQGLMQYVDQQMSGNVSGAKKPDVIKNRLLVKNRTLGFYKGHREQLKMLFDLHNLLADAKNIIVKKLSTLEQSTRSFIRTSDGLKSSNPEGFVCTDHIGNTVKLVDRLTFSTANFNMAKNWK